MDAETIKQGIKDAQEHLQTTRNSVARSRLLKQIMKWREELVYLERAEKWES